jgi:hypothetical protein
VHNSDNLCELLHKRMGHLDHRALPILTETVTCFPEFNIEQDGVCRECTLGEHAKAAFPSSEHRSKQILDLLHSGVCGQMTVASMTRSIYYGSFIDDFSRKTWIYFLKTNDEVFSKFQEFKALVENQTGEKIKVLISNKWVRVYLQGVRGFLQGGRNQEGDDNSVQPTIE